MRRIANAWFRAEVSRTTSAFNSALLQWQYVVSFQASIVHFCHSHKVLGGVQCEMCCTHCAVCAAAGNPGLPPSHPPPRRITDRETALANSVMIIAVIIWNNFKDANIIINTNEVILLTKKIMILIYWDLKVWKFLKSCKPCRLEHLVKT